MCPGVMFQADPELQHLQETVISLFRPEGEGFLCRNLLQTPLEHQVEEYPLVRCEGVFTIQVSMQCDQLCVYPSTDDREGPAYLGQENTFTGPDSVGLLFSLQMSPDSPWRVIQDVCSSEGNEAPHIINPTLLKDTVTEMVE
ncbi:DDE_3 domain-containing protein [Trichonephila clavipes]|nr:DDE_3 domain-containing protein [Trichonephila clavipes]